MNSQLHAFIESKKRELKCDHATAKVNSWSEGNTKEIYEVEFLRRSGDGWTPVKRIMFSCPLE